MKSSIVRSVTVLFVLAAAPAAAQIPLNPRALGMGNAYLGLARGQDALFQNPANLALPGNPHWSVAVPQIVAGGTALGLEFEDVLDLRNYDDFSEEEAADLLAEIPETGTDFEYDVRVPFAAVQVGRIALGASYGTIGNHTLDKDLVDFALRGYQEGRFDYDAPNTVGYRASYIDLAAGTARRFGPLSVGVTGHYYIGRALVASRLMDIVVDIPNQTATADYTSIRSNGGSGFGVDVGAAFQPMPGLTLSAVVANAFSDMSWDEDLRQRTLTITEADVEGGEFEDLRLRYEDSETDFTSSSNAQVQALANTLFDDTQLPATLKAGAAFTPVPGTQLGATYQQELEESRISGLWERTLGVGVQQRVAFLTLRAGVASNLDEGSLLTAGLSFGPIQVGVGRLSNGSRDGADRNGWVATFGLAGRSNTTMP